MSDTAEYWFDIKSSFGGYSGRNFKHNPNHHCSHYKPASGNTLTTVYIEDINCFECVENIKNDGSLKDGLKEGKAPETYYMSNSQKKKFNARKRFDELHGICSCGSKWTIRKNKNTNEDFLGCSRYPKCKNTKSIGVN